MNDSLHNTIQLGDWVIYGKSNYLRVAKIIETGMRGSNSYIKLFAAGHDCKVYYREVQTWSTTLWSVLYLEDPPIAQRDAIEQRLLKEQSKGKYLNVP